MSASGVERKLRAAVRCGEDKVEHARAARRMALQGAPPSRSDVLREREAALRSGVAWVERGKAASGSPARPGGRDRVAVGNSPSVKPRKEQSSRESVAAPRVPAIGSRVQLTGLAAASEKRYAREMTMAPRSSRSLDVRAGGAVDAARVAYVAHDGREAHGARASAGEAMRDLKREPGRVPTGDIPSGDEADDEGSLEEDERPPMREFARERETHPVVELVADSRADFLSRDSAWQCGQMVQPDDGSARVFRPFAHYVASIRAWGPHRPRLKSDPVVTAEGILFGGPGHAVRRWINTTDGRMRIRLVSTLVLGDGPARTVRTAAAAEPVPTISLAAEPVPAINLELPPPPLLAESSARDSTRSQIPSSTRLATRRRRRARHVSPPASSRSRSGSARSRSRSRSPIEPEPAAVLSLPVRRARRNSIVVQLDGTMLQARPAATPSPLARRSASPEPQAAEHVRAEISVGGRVSWSGVVSRDGLDLDVDLTLQSGQSVDLTFHSTVREMVSVRALVRVIRHRLAHRVVNELSLIAQRGEHYGATTLAQLVAAWRSLAEVGVPNHLEQLWDRAESLGLVPAGPSDDSAVQAFLERALRDLVRTHALFGSLQLAVAWADRAQVDYALDVASSGAVADALVVARLREHGHAVEEAALLRAAAPSASRVRAFVTECIRLQLVRDAADALDEYLQRTAGDGGAQLGVAELLADVACAFAEHDDAAEALAWTARLDRLGVSWPRRLWVAVTCCHCRARRFADAVDVFWRMVRAGVLATEALEAVMHLGFSHPDSFERAHELHRALEHLHIRIPPHIAGWRRPTKRP